MEVMLAADHILPRLTIAIPTVNRAEILGRKGCFPLFARRNRPSEARQPRQPSVGTGGSGKGKWRANRIGSNVFRYRRDIVLNGG